VSVILSYARDCSMEKYITGCPFKTLALALKKNNLALDHEPIVICSVCTNEYSETVV